MLLMSSVLYRKIVLQCWLQCYSILRSNDWGIGILSAPAPLGPSRGQTAAKREGQGDQCLSHARLCFTVRTFSSREYRRALRRIQIQTVYQPLCFRSRDLCWPQWPKRYGFRRALVRMRATVDLPQSQVAPLISIRPMSPSIAEVLLNSSRPHALARSLPQLAVVYPGDVPPDPPSDLVQIGFVTWRNMQRSSSESWK